MPEFNSDVKVLRAIASCSFARLQSEVNAEFLASSAVKTPDAGRSSATLCWGPGSLICIPLRAHKEQNHRSLAQASQVPAPAPWPTGLPTVCARLLGLVTVFRDGNRQDISNVRFANVAIIHYDDR